MPGKSSDSSSPKTMDWGRRKHANWISGVKAIALMTSSPCLALLLAINMEYNNGELWYLFDRSTIVSVWNELSYKPLSHMHWAIAGFLAFQAIIYRILPGRIHTGQYTPGGQILRYKTNGLAALLVTNFTYWAGHFCGLFRASYIAADFSTLIIALNIWGLALTIAVYVKARVAPTSLRDSVFTGNVFYDICMGVELNPRVPFIDDLKLFIVGRGGMMMWSLVLMSFAVLQYEIVGRVSLSMLSGVGLQLIYIIDLFWNEHWYIRTIDIAHDHVGFYISWGCFAWLPATYTLHVQFIARSGVEVGDSASMICFVLGCAGYVLFRLANDQKYWVRESNGKCKVWGRPATYITARYKTADGSHREAILLTCGWWGIARHINYVGDLVLSFSTCAVTGFSSILPWFYAIYLSVLLCHRCIRDEARCQKKYGKDWEKYCQEVPWRLIPYIY